MRTHYLATFMGLSLVACAGQIESGPGDDDDVPTEDCGNGVEDVGEGCDDGNNLDGDGCSATCTEEATPRVVVTVDAPALTTDLYVENEVNITLTSTDGFSGPVTLSAAAVDATSAPIADWTVTLVDQVLEVPLDGSISTVVSVMVPGDAATLAGTVKLTTTSSADPVEVPISVTANPVVSISYTTTGNNCVYPTQFNIANPVRIKVNRALRVVNDGTLQMQIHFDGGISGISHQDDPMAPGVAYEQTPQAPSGGANVTFYCHNANQPGVVAVEAPNSTNLRQRLVVVE